jgi:hypothetical protein
MPGDHHDSSAHSWDTQNACRTALSIDTLGRIIEQQTAMQRMGQTASLTGTYQVIRPPTATLALSS